MSSAVDIHPLVTALRSKMDAEDLTQQQVAEAIGVSTRAVQYWLAQDVTPQKRYRQAIRRWVNGETP